MLLELLELYEEEELLLPELLELYEDELLLLELEELFVLAGVSVGSGVI